MLLGCSRFDVAEMWRRMKKERNSSYTYCVRDRPKQRFTTKDRPFSASTSVMLSRFGSSRNGNSRPVAVGAVGNLVGHRRTPAARHFPGLARFHSSGKLHSVPSSPPVNCQLSAVNAIHPSHQHPTSIQHEELTASASHHAAHPIRVSTVSHRPVLHQYIASPA